MIESPLLEDVCQNVQLFVAFGAALLQQAGKSCVRLFWRNFSLNYDGE